MPIRPFRVCIPVLVEDVAKPHGLAVHDKIEIIVEAQNHYEAARALERHWNDNLPQGLTVIRRLERCPEHMATRVEWQDPPLPDVGETIIRRHMDGRFEGLDRERGVLRFSTSVGNEVPRVIPGATFEIPFEDIAHVNADEWEHEHFEGMNDVQQRLRLSVSGHFNWLNHNTGGVEINMPETYVSHPYEGGVIVIAGPSHPLGLDT